MPKINPLFDSLTRTYIFSKIEEKAAQKPEAINLGIGDIVRPIQAPIISALQDAAEEMARKPIGYAPSLGYPFLREAVHQHYYKNFSFDESAVFISDGINSDCLNLLELFAPDVTIGLPDPAYPAYFDGALISGKAHLIKLPCLEENGFSPEPPDRPLDLIFLCSPSNPTGTAMSASELKRWVDYALENDAILLFDGAYLDFIQTPGVPRSIYEIPGAEKVAIEMRSFSKSYGFTGLRCSSTVVPMEPYRSLWARRQNCKTNGIAYPIQKAALKALSLPLLDVEHYMAQTHILKEGLSSLGFTLYGGTDAPYIWVKVPEGYDSWSFFDHLLEVCGILTIPGPGFGPRGEGFIRFSGFTNQAEIAIETLKRSSRALLCR